LCFIQPTRLHNPNGESMGSAIFAQLTAECRRAYPGMSFPLIIVPSHWIGDLGPHLIHASLGPPESISYNPNNISIGSAVFAQFTSECRRSCWGMSFHLKIACPWRICTPPPSNAGSLGPPNLHPKRHLGRLSRFCTAHGIKSLYFTMGAPFPLKTTPAPLPMGHLDPI